MLKIKLIDEEIEYLNSSIKEYEEDKSNLFKHYTELKKLISDD